MTGLGGKWTSRNPMAGGGRRGVTQTLSASTDVARIIVLTMRAPPSAAPSPNGWTNMIRMTTVTRAGRRP